MKMNTGRTWDKDDLRLLHKCIKVPSRAALNKHYISWERVSDLMNKQANDRRHHAFKPFSALECKSRYQRSLIFTLSARKDFNPDNYGVRSLPWSKAEINRLRSLIPTILPAGQDKSDTHLLPNNLPDWPRIAAKMATESANDSVREYIPVSVAMAYAVRITRDHFSHLDSAGMAGSPDAEAALRALELAELIMYSPDGDTEDHVPMDSAWISRWAAFQVGRPR